MTKPKFNTTVCFHCGVDKAVEIAKAFEQGKLAVLEMLDDSALLEGLSNIEHEQWMKWSKTISLQESIGQERIGRWKKLWIPYLELTEQDKDHDRKWAKLVLMVIIERLKSQLKEVD